MVVYVVGREFLAVYACRLYYDIYIGILNFPLAQLYHVLPRRTVWIVIKDQREQLSVFSLSIRCGLGWMHAFKRRRKRRTKSSLNRFWSIYNDYAREWEGPASSSRSSQLGSSSRFRAVWEFARVRIARNVVRAAFATRGAYTSLL